MPRASTSSLLTTPRGLYTYYGICAALCLAMCVAILQCEVRYALTANDADVRQQCDVQILSVRSFATCLYAAICVPALAQLLSSALVASDTLAELAGVGEEASLALRSTKLIRRSVMVGKSVFRPPPNEPGKLLVIFRRLALSSVAQIALGAFAAATNYFTSRFITGALSYGEPSPAEYYHGWIANTLQVVICDYGLIALETYCFHLGLSARITQNAQALHVMHMQHRSSIQTPGARGSRSASVRLSFFPFRRRESALRSSSDESGASGERSLGQILAAGARRTIGGSPGGGTPPGAVRNNLLAVRESQELYLSASL